MKIRMKLISVSIIFFLAGFLIEVYGNIIYVDTLANAAKDGSSWINAYSSLKLALESAAIGDTICIKEGIYIPDLNDNSISYTTVQSIKIYGGFSGAELFGEPGFWSNRDPILYETILSGDINGDDVGTTNNSDNCLHIMTNSASDVLLDGLSFIGGNATSNSGGAIYSTAGNMIFNNLKFFYNNALFGGAIYMSTTDYVADSCIFYRNEAESTGGAIYNISSNGNFYNSNFIDNYVPANPNGDNQSIYSTSACSLNFVNSIFWQFTQVNGDMIYDGSSVLTYYYCLIMDSPSTDWYLNFGVDGGNNISGYPDFYDHENLNFDLYDVSPAINTGNGVNGINIGYYQGSGIVSPEIILNKSLLEFDTILVGDSTLEQSYTVEGTNLTGDIIIVAPTGFEISLSSGDYSDKTDSIQLTHSSGSIVSTTVYVRFKPANEGNKNGFIKHVVVDWLYPDTLFVTGTAVVPTMNVENNTVLFDDVFLGQSSDEISYVVSGKYLSGNITITTSGAFQITSVSGDYSGNTGEIIIEPVDGVVSDTIIYARFTPVNEGYTGAYIAHNSPEISTINKLVHGTAVHAPVYFVDLAATGNENGSTWEHAFVSLQDALAEVSFGDTIVIAKGKYKPHASARGAYFNMKDGVKIFGGFRGDEMIDSSSIANRNFDSNETILSGDLGENDDSGIVTDNCYHVVRFYGITTEFSESTLLDGLTISGGNADLASSGNDKGGAIYFVNGSSKNCSPTLRNLVLENNRARNGGAIYLDGVINANSGFYGLFENVIFQNNEAFYTTGAGGAAYLSAVPTTECSPRFVSCAFLNNNSQHTGGAVYVVGGYEGGPGIALPVFNNTTFYGNISTLSTGTAIYVNGQEGNASPEFNNVIFYGNPETQIYKFVTSGTANPTYNHCLITGSPSSSWNSGIGVDFGNNIEGNPLFIDPDNGIISVLDGSPVLGTGDATYGNNIGYYQGSGELEPELTVTGNLIYFGLVEVGEVSSEQLLTVTGSGLLGDVEIYAPPGFEISTQTGVNFISESPIVLQPISGVLSNITIYMRFAPTESGAYSDSLAIKTAAVVTQYKVTEGYAGGKPGISEIADISICTGNVAQSSFLVTDDDLPSIVITALSDNEILLPSDSITILGSLGNYDIYISPPKNSKGSVNVTVTATDSALNDTSTVFVLQLTPGPVIESEFTQMSCRYSNDALIIASSSGGLKPVDYKLSTSGFFSSDSVFRDLGTGEYYVVVKDANNCTDTTEAFEVVNPPELMGTAQLGQNITCNGFGDGEINASASGGWGNYSYSIDGEIFQSDSVFGDLETGGYNIYVKDSLECYKLLEYIYIDEPSALIIESISVYDNLPDYNIFIYAYGGIQPYMYSIDGVNYQEDANFYAVTPGTITTYVKDFNGCVTQKEVNVATSNLPVTKLNRIYTIYPNPTHDILYLETDESLSKVSSFKIINSQGQVLMHKTFTSMKEFNGQIRIESLPPNIYTIQLKLENIEFLSIQFLVVN